MLSIFYAIEKVNILSIFENFHSFFFNHVSIDQYRDFKKNVAGIFFISYISCRTVALRS